MFSIGQLNCTCTVCECSN